MMFKSGKRLFSSGREKLELLYAKRCENGQGSSFMFQNMKKEERVDVSYSTFWNDFSHYSFYGPPSSKVSTISAPISYNQLGKAGEDMLFADIEKFVEGNTDQ